MKLAEEIRMMDDEALAEYLSELMLTKEYWLQELQKEVGWDAES